MEKLFIVKIGGSIIDDEKKLAAFLKDFASIKEAKLLIHGGGKLAGKIAEAMGIPQQMVNGRRITNAETLKVVTMVYAGYINKTIVALLQAGNCNAIGICGADGNLIQAHKRNIPSQTAATDNTTDYGFAGDIDVVNGKLLQQFLANKNTVVIAPITHDKNGLLLNTNADTIANEIAKAMAGLYKVSLIYCFEKNAVLADVEDENSGLESIDREDYETLKNKKLVNEGMIPKLDNAFEALRSGVAHVTIGHADNLQMLLQQKSGTAIVND